MISNSTYVATQMVLQRLEAVHRVVGRRCRTRCNTTSCRRPPQLPVRPGVFLWRGGPVSDAWGSVSSCRSRG